jgi:hypothetical protein
LGGAGVGDPAALSAGELCCELGGLEAARRRLDARYLAVLGEYDHRGVYAAAGAVSAATELAYRHGRDSRDLRRDVTVAKKLRRLAVMAAAVAAGEVTFAHAEVLCRALTVKTETAMDRDEARLVAMARRLGVDDYRKALRHWKAHADPDGTEDPNVGLRRELHLSESLDGDFFGTMRFDPELGGTVKAALDELHRHGDNGTAEEAPAPVAQRRAEALAELCRRGGAVTADGEPHRRTRPQLVVTIDHDNLIDQLGLGELAGGGTISTTAVRRLACDADIITAVFGTDSELLDLGRRARLVSPAQRLALVMRDRGCVFPNCDRPPDWCDAHHIDHWLDQGPTDLDNLCLLCSKHHHLVHEDDWALQRSVEGELIFTVPGGLTLPPRAHRPGHPDPFLTTETDTEPPDPQPPEPEPPARGAPAENDR